MHAAGLSCGEWAADEEGWRGWDPAGLHRHSLIVANRPVFDHQTALDSLEVRLSHGEGLTGRHECSLACFLWSEAHYTQWLAGLIRRAIFTDARLA